MFFLHIWKPNLDSVICADDCFQSCSGEAPPLWPSSLIVSPDVQKLLFLETVYSFNLFLKSISQILLHTPTPIYCCSTFQCLLTTLSVINNVNMSFFWIKISTKLHPMRVYLGHFYCGVMILTWDCGNMSDGRNVSPARFVLVTVAWCKAPPTAKSLLLQLGNNPICTSTLLFFSLSSKIV